MYKERYGQWAGSSGSAPDKTRCCEEVTTYVGRWPSFHQCRRKRIGESFYCKQHDPETVKAKRAAADEKYRKDFNASRYKYYGPTFFRVLEKIAAGHNDARGLAQETIDEFMKGMR